MNMKNILLTSLIMLNFIINYGQQPQTVYSIVKDLHEVSWYEEQLELWKKEIDKNEKNANAWYNYYTSSRALKNLTQDKEREHYQELCLKITEDLYRILPESFEANHLKWWNAGNDKNEFKYLEKAYQINPNDPRTYNDLMTYYETERIKDKYTEFCLKYYEANELAAPLLNWGYNVLAGLEENAIVLSAGDNDTYPIWTVQEYKGFRQDVKNINTYLILIDNYRNKLFQELEIPKLDINLKEVESKEDYDNKVKQIYEHILLNYTKGPVHICANAIFQLEDWSEDFHLVGLTYKYSKEDFDNISIIQRNYENRYLLDHIKQVFSFNINNGVADRMDAIYLPSMIKLYKHYKTSEEFSRMNKLMVLIKNISERTNQWDKVKELLEEE